MCIQLGNLSFKKMENAKQLRLQLLGVSVFKMIPVHLIGDGV